MAHARRWPAPIGSFATGFIKGNKPKPNKFELEVPYNGQILKGDSLQRQIDKWVRQGVCELSCGSAISQVANAEPWLDLSDRYFVLLGAGAAMGPFQVRRTASWRGATMAMRGAPDRRIRSPRLDRAPRIPARCVTDEQAVGMRRQTASPPRATAVSSGAARGNRRCACATSRACTHRCAGGGCQFTLDHWPLSPNLVVGFAPFAGTPRSWRQHHCRRHWSPRHLEASHLADERLMRHPHIPDEGVPLPAQRVGRPVGLPLTPRTLVLWQICWRLIRSTAANRPRLPPLAACSLDLSSRRRQTTPSTRRQVATCSHRPPRSRTGSAR